MDARTTPAKIAPGTLKIRNLSAAPEVLAELGVDIRPLLAKAGLGPELFADPELRISYLALGRFVRDCVAVTGCEDFGLRVGMRQSAPILGLSGYVAANAPTVREALDIITASLRLSDTGGRVSFSVERGFASLNWLITEPDVEAAEHIDDAAIAIACNIMRSLRGPQWSPAEVRLTRARPKSAANFQRFFNAPVRFETETASLMFDATDLDCEVAGRDPTLHAILAPLLEKALEETELSVKEDVSDILRAQVLKGPLTPDRAAAALGISARTLSRRLAEERATFSELAQSVRFEVAQRLLRTEKNLSEISALLGYSDPTAFIRAFKQFTGKTPARWRRER